MALAPLLYLIVIPAIASLIAITLGWLAYADLRSRDPSGDVTRRASARFPVYPAIVITPVIFGLVLWMLSNPVADRLEQGLARTPDPTYALASSLYTSAAIAFAVVASLSVLSQALVVRARIRGFVGADFGRVEPLIVVPETAAVFALVLGFLIIGQVTSMIDAQLITTATKVEATVLAFEAFALSAVAMPLATLAANRVEDLHGRGFPRAILLGEAGVVVVLLAFVWTFLQVSAL